MRTLAGLPVRILGASRVVNETEAGEVSLGSISVPVCSCKGAGSSWASTSSPLKAAREVTLEAKVSGAGLAVQTVRMIRRPRTRTGRSVWFASRRP